MSLMEKEALESPGVIAKQFLENQSAIVELCKRLKKTPPAFAMMIGRGSSGHATVYGKYLLETQLGIACSYSAPSIQTVYNSPLKLNQCLAIGISQSGQSTDISEVMQHAKDSGACTVAIVNEVDSPLADIAEFCIPLHAGKEISVAATKSYISSLSALLHITAGLSETNLLHDLLTQLPERLTLAQNLDWSQLVDELKDTSDMITLARGYSFPIASEAALKLQETSAIHAESFSSAEVLHGPFELVRKDFPFLCFGQNDASLPGMLDTCDRIIKIGGKVYFSMPQPDNAIELPGMVLPQAPSLHPICDPLLNIQAFYLFAAKLAIARGLDPDKPHNLKKVTITR